MQGGLDARDASTVTLLLDIAQLLKLLYEKCGDGLLTYLGREVLPSLGAAPALQVLPFSPCAWAGPDLQHQPSRHPNRAPLAWKGGGGGGGGVCVRNGQRTSDSGRLFET